MPSVTLSSSERSVKLILSKTFPDFKGREVEVKIEETVIFHSTNWNEGYCREYILFDTTNSKTIYIEEAPFLQNSNLHQDKHAIPPHIIVVVLIHSSCKQSICMIARPEVVTPMLPKQEILSDDEKTVLLFTRKLVPSYAGIKDYRFNQASQRRGITRQRWDNAKQSLIDRGFLNKVGALTISGKNVVPDEQI